MVTAHRRIIQLTWVLLVPSIFSEALSDAKTGPFMTYELVAGKPYKVAFDGQSVVINGKRTLLLGGSIHYARSFPADWERLLKDARSQDLNLITVDVFWNVHEPERGKFQWDGPFCLSDFLKLCAAAGLFVHIRLGPYLGEQWSFGGLPTWTRSLRDGFRTAEGEWADVAADFVRKAAFQVLPFVAKNGGPVILAQVERAYKGKEAYQTWCLDLARSLNFEVPIVTDADFRNWPIFPKQAEQVLQACLGDSCGSEEKTMHERPVLWTEDASNLENLVWLKKPQTKPQHSLKDTRETAFKVALWFAEGGTYHNYHMWYGGNHMGSSAAAGVTNRYDDSGSLHFDTLKAEPMYSHLKTLHQKLAVYNELILFGALPPKNSVSVPCCHWERVFSLQNSLGDVVQKVTFVVNEGDQPTETDYGLEVPPRSVTLVENDVMVYTTYTDAKDDYGKGMIPYQRMYGELLHGKEGDWDFFEEPLPRLIYPGWSQHSSAPLEMLLVTGSIKDNPQYLVYTWDQAIPAKKGPQHLVVEGRTSQAIMVFVDGFLVDESVEMSSAAGPYVFTFRLPNCEKPSHLSIVVSSFGVSDEVEPGSLGLDQDQKGIVGRVWMEGVDITKMGWHHSIPVGLENKVFDPKVGSNAVKWTRLGEDGQKPKFRTKKLPMNVGDAACGMLVAGTCGKMRNGGAYVWYRTRFGAPPEAATKDPEGSFLLDLGEDDGPRRGHIFFNGVDLGRYSNHRIDKDPVQRYYYLPKSLFQKVNTLVLLEESGGDPRSIRILESHLSELPQDQYV